MSVMGHGIPLSSPILQAWSLIIYSLFLVPGLNLVLPGVVFLALYFYLHRRRLSQRPDKRHANALLVVPGLLLLLFINIVFMADTELTIHRGVKQQQSGESQWTFGQTLALRLLSLPIRDTALLEFYRRESKRREFMRHGISKFSRGIELGDVDTVIMFAGLQEVNVNVEVTTGGCFLLRIGSDSFYTGDFASALQLAAHAGRLSLVKQLLDRHALVDKTGNDHFYHLQ
jgi:hypothetical protein